MVPELIVKVQPKHSPLCLTHKKPSFPQGSPETGLNWLAKEIINLSLPATS